jgi:hypothetical protein
MQIEPPGGTHVAGPSHTAAGASQSDHVVSYAGVGGVSFDWHTAFVSTGGNDARNAPPIAPPEQIPGSAGWVMNDDCGQPATFNVAVSAHAEPLGVQLHG